MYASTALVSPATPLVACTPGNHKAALGRADTPKSFARMGHVAATLLWSAVYASTALVSPARSLPAITPGNHKAVLGRADTPQSFARTGHVAAARLYRGASESAHHWRRHAQSVVSLNVESSVLSVLTFNVEHSTLNIEFVLRVSNPRTSPDAQYLWSAGCLRPLSLWAA